MGKGEFAREMLSAASEGLKNAVDRRVEDERWNNITYAAMAMLESGVDKNQIEKMLMKYWDLRPSEASDIYLDAEKMLSHM